LIFQWFEWRKTYKRLEEFRNIVSRFIFFFVISTTLITFMINKLINSLKLNNSKIIREFVDKKNIFINVHFIQKEIDFSNENLRWLIRLDRIFKIIIYDEFIKRFLNMKRMLDKFYKKSYRTSMSSSFVVLMNSCQMRKKTKYTKNSSSQNRISKFFVSRM
jgi:hypothetical protein